MNNAQRYNVWTWDSMQYAIILEEDKNLTYKEAIKQCKLSQEMDIENSIGFDGETREEVVENSQPIEQVIAPVGHDVVSEGLNDDCELVDSWII